jgi:hypothetical protein
VIERLFGAVAGRVQGGQVMAQGFGVTLEIDQAAGELVLNERVVGRYAAGAVDLSDGRLRL